MKGWIKHISLSAVALVMSSVAGTSQTLTAECQDLFEQADVNRDGVLQADEAKAYIDAMAQAKIAPRDPSVVTFEEFIIECRKGTFASLRS